MCTHLPAVGTPQSAELIQCVGAVPFDRASLQRHVPSLVWITVESHLNLYQCLADVRQRLPHVALTHSGV